MNGRSLSVVVIAPLRFPIRRPHAGGLEAAVWNEIAQLRRRGHRVTLIGPEGSDWVHPQSPFSLPALRWPDTRLATDDTYPPMYEEVVVAALDSALDHLAATADDYDVISNHCLHGLPLQRAAELGVPMISTLHTPVDADLVARHNRGGGSRFLSVSHHTKSEWAGSGIQSTVLPNGVDPSAWPLGPGGDELVWFGRLVPEKAPHLAIEVAERLGLPLVLAGRVGDLRYAEEQVFPRLGESVRYVGQLEPKRLAELVGRSLCSLATPAWEEPFGLVAPEALMCGTPVATFAVGGVPEIAAGTVGMATAAPGDVEALAEAARALIARSRRDGTFRAAISEGAAARFSLDARIGQLEQRFFDLIDDEALPEQAA